MTIPANPMRSDDRSESGRPMPAHDQFLALVDSHRGALLKVCWAYGRSQHDRDDLMQEILARLWSALPRYDSARPFSTWMYRVALNVAIDYRRRQRRWSRESGGTDLELAAPAERGADQVQELRELLERHSDADRALLLLCLEGRSYREIGEVLGISETNVGTRLNRLKQALRQSVGEQERK